MRRGEIWVYRPVLERPGQARLRLIVSNDAINRDESLPIVRGIQVLDRDPGGLLSVRVEPHGWAAVLTSEAVMRSRLVDQVCAATADEVAAVEVAIAAMYALPR